MTVWVDSWIARMFFPPGPINIPIFSATALYNGQRVAGVYTIVALDGTHVTVTAEDPKNELVGASITVVADGVTVNKNVIGGLAIIFDGGLAAGWTAIVACGASAAAVAGQWTTAPPWGPWPRWASSRGRCGRWRRPS